MECDFSWTWIADLLDELELDPHLGHPPAIKVLAKNETKGRPRVPLSDQKTCARYATGWTQPA
jgi:hypothetical protein